MCEMSRNEVLSDWEASGGLQRQTLLQMLQVALRLLYSVQQLLAGLRSAEYCRGSGVRQRIVSEGVLELELETEGEVEQAQTVERVEEG
jgi:hypothetical protein